MANLRVKLLHSCDCNDMVAAAKKMSCGWYGEQNVARGTREEAKNAGLPRGVWTSDNRVYGRLRIRHARRQGSDGTWVHARSCESVFFSKEHLFRIVVRG